MEVNQDQGSTRGRKSGEGQHLAEVLALYRAGDSLGVIKEKTGISVQTLSRWLKKAGVEIDPKRGLSAPRGPLSEEHRAAVSEAKAGVPITKRASWRNEVRACSRCGTEFAPTAPKQQSCSDECRLASLADRNRASIKIRHCPCGTQLPPFTETHSAYCSPECRETYANKGGRKRQDEKWVTKTCLNCEVEFELRTSSQSYGKYCSNACAMRHTKTKRHLVMKDSDVLLDSSYEALVWAALMVAKIPVERFDRQHGVEWGEGCWYAPDLWLSGQQIAIEVKGALDDDDAARWDAYRALNIRLAVLDRTDLMSMSPTTALAIVENAAY